MTPNPKPRVAIVVSDPDLRDELARQFDDSGEVVTSLGDPGTLRLLSESSPVGGHPRPRPRHLRRAGAAAPHRRLPRAALDARDRPVVARRLPDLREGAPARRRGVRHQALPAGGPAPQARRRWRPAANSVPPAASSWAPCWSPAASSRRSSSTTPSSTSTTTAAGSARSWCATASSPEMDIVNALAGQMRISRDRPHRQRAPAGRHGPPAARLHRPPPPHPPARSTTTATSCSR